MKRLFMRCKLLVGIVILAMLSACDTAQAINGDIAFSTNRDGNYEIYRMKPNGTSPVNVTNNAADDSTPSWNRDSTRIAFASRRPDTDRELYTMLANGDSQARYSFHAGDDSNPTWNPSESRIIYTSTLSGQPDLWYVDTGGEAPSGLKAAAQQRDGIDSFAAWSRDGSRVVFASQRTANEGSGVGDFNIWVMDCDTGTDDFGTPVQLTTAAGDDTHPHWNSDGTKIVFASQRVDNSSGNVADFNIWEMSFDKTTNTAGTPVQLTNDASQDVYPCYAPDGDRIAFQSDRAGNEDIWVMNADGSAETNLTAASAANDVEPSWSKQQETPSLVVTIATDTEDIFDGETSLREALAYAASLGSAQNITFAPALNGGTILVSTIGDNSLGNSAYKIVSPVNIKSSSNGITIRSEAADYPLRAFLVTTGGSLTMRGVTVDGFLLAGPDGPNFGTDVQMAGLNGQGGAICNLGGTVRLDSCLLKNNSATGGAGGARTFFNFDTFEDDYVRGAGGNGSGGAIYTGPTRLTTLVQCTLANNSAAGGLGGLINGTRGPDGNGLGGAIANDGGTTVLVACSVGFNSVSGTAPVGGAVWASGPAASTTTALRSTILANSTGAPDADNTDGAWSNTASIIQSQTAGVPATGALATNPKFNALANNGGLSWTLGLQPGSPAIGAGDSSIQDPPYSLTTDQRGSGFPRLRGAQVDIGAFEAPGPASPPVLTITTPAHGSLVNSLPQVKGTATDLDGIKTIKLYLRRDPDLSYWNGSTWGAKTALTVNLVGTAWSCTSPLPTVAQLNDGRYALIAEATDNFDTAGAKSSGFYVDKTAPVTVTITTPVHQSTVRSIAPVTGTVADNAGGFGIQRVDLTLKRVSDGKYWSGSQWMTSPTPLPTGLSGTNWTKNTFPPPGANVNTQLQEGNYILMATAYDKAGNKSPKAARSDIAIDRTVPKTVTFTIPKNLTFVKTLAPVTGTAADNVGGSGIVRVDLTLQRVSDAKFWSGTAWVAASTPLQTAFSAGNWTKNSFPPAGTDPNTQLLEGKYALMAKAVDKAGNVSPSPAKCTVTIDRTLPSSVTITSPANGATVKTFAPLTGTAADNAGGSGLAQVDVTLKRVSDGKFWSGSAWEATATPLPTGLTGNDWVKNTFPPGGTNPATQLVDGQYVLTATAVDKAGNKSVKPATITVTVDRSLPKATITSPAHGTVVATLTAIHGTAFDAVSSVTGVSFTLKRNSDGLYWSGTAWAAAATTLNAGVTPGSGGNATWSYGNASQPLPQAGDLVNGKYLLTVRAADTAGNSSAAATSTFTVSQAAPARVAPIESSPLLLSSLSARADGTVQLVFTGAVSASAATDVARYGVARAGTAVEVVSAQATHSSVVVLGVEEGVLRAGDRVKVSYDLLDSRGRVLVGTMDTTVW